MLTKEYIPAPLDERIALAMAVAQAGVNRRRDPEWLQAGWPLLRAAVVEGARALERLDWKGLKREEGRRGAIAECLAGIWRHGLSHLIVERRGDLTAVSRYLSWSSRHEPGPVRLGEVARDPRELDLAGRLEMVVGLCAIGRFPLAILGSLLVESGVDWPTLARKHLADCALESFRMEQGLSESAPLTFADGRDDREHLYELAASQDCRDADYSDTLRRALAERWESEGQPLSLTNNRDTHLSDEPMGVPVIGQ